MPDEFDWKAGDGELGTVKALFREPADKTAFLRALMKVHGAFRGIGHHCWLPEGPGLSGGREGGP